MRPLIAALLLVWTLPAPAAGPKCPTTLPQEQLNECFVAAFEESEQRLETLMRDLRKSLGSKQWAHLKESQEFWAKSRSIDCKIEASFLDGPVREAVRYGCSEKRTRERMHQLRYYLCPRYNLTGQCDVERLYE